MQQLSRPYQIAIGALLVFALAWFTVLKPSDEVAEPAAAAPGVAGLNSAVTKAETAAAVSAASVTATRAGADAAGADTGTTGPGLPALPALTGAAAATNATGATGATGPVAAAGDPSAPILRDVAADKVAVLLFHSLKAADDRAVLRAVRRADRHDGRMVVRTATIASVARYAAITEGVEVAQSPTLLVIGKDNRARTLVGFTDTRAIDQLVGDVGGAAFAARRVTGYRERIDNICALVRESRDDVNAVGPDTAARVATRREDIADVRRQLQQRPAPRRYVTFQRRLSATYGAVVDGLDAWSAAFARGETQQSVLAAEARRIASTDARLQRAAARVDIEGC